MWHGPQLSFDGRVLGCCSNYAGWGDYGNAFDLGLEETLNGERMRYARAMLLGRKTARDDIPCSKCPRYRDMQRSGNWLRPSEIRFMSALGAVKRSGLIPSRLYASLYRLCFHLFRK